MGKGPLLEVFVVLCLCEDHILSVNMNRRADLHLVTQLRCNMSVLTPVLLLGVDAPTSLLVDVSSRAHLLFQTVLALVFIVNYGCEELTLLLDLPARAQISVGPARAAPKLLVLATLRLLVLLMIDVVLGFFDVFDQVSVLLLLLYLVQLLLRFSYLLLLLFILYVLHHRLLLRGAQLFHLVLFLLLLGRMQALVVLLEGV
jgi:hypothetical protein